MAADAPIIRYKREEDNIASKSQMDDLADRWNERRKKQGGMSGKKISLSEYLRKDNI